MSTWIRLFKGILAGHFWRRMGTLLAMKPRDIQLAASSTGQINDSDYLVYAF